jgi:hypothetical protein
MIKRFLGNGKFKKAKVAWGKEENGFRAYL